MPDIVAVVPELLPQDDTAKKEIYTRLAAAIGVPVDDVRSPVEQELATTTAKNRAPQSEDQGADQLNGQDSRPTKSRRPARSRHKWKAWWSSIPLPIWSKFTAPSIHMYR